MIDIRLGDCLSVMQTIPDGSIDLVCADLPYQVTACRWDVMIPFEPLWANYRRLLKPHGAVVLTAAQPFTSMLVVSNPKWFRYGMVWDKVNKYTDFINAKRRPMRRHEDILVFAPGGTTYNPQSVPCTPYKTRRYKAYATEFIHAGTNVKDCGRTVETRGPCSVISIKANVTKRLLHPTQKPVALMEYLIKTYSNEGDTVLDSTMGSGTTLVACLNTGRHGIGIESDPVYFQTAELRIAEELAKTALLTA